MQINKDMLSHFNANMYKNEDTTRILEMRIRKSVLIFASTLFLSFLFLLYQIKSLTDESHQQGKQINYVSLVESRIKQLEEETVANQNTVQGIKSILHHLIDSDAGASAVKPDKVVNQFLRNEETDLDPYKKIGGQPIFNLSKAIIHVDDCLFCQTYPSSVNLQIDKIIEKIPFDNPDGGAWKQGWDIKYESSQWSPQKKLKVFVVPHSHNDPGWLNTFEEYFFYRTRHILDNMVVKLQEDHRRKFIWAEISFLSLWWDRQSKEVKDKVKKLVQNGQLEIVTGGWVMPDEASPHYYAMLDQLLTGHEWVQLNLDVKPTNGWSIDPFGMGPTMAYLLKMSGFENMLIQRTHYAMKKYFAEEKSLEFRWRQLWDTASTTDILCHMMPFFSYNIPHTCGPDPYICGQFDFRRLPCNWLTCLWRPPPQRISDINVEARSTLLLDQYRKKAQLYRTNALLVPLGDDFRYDKPSEWDEQFNNYQALFDYMNSREDWHVQAQFGTLADYFRAVREDSSLSGKDEEFFPSFSGDFFSYSDKNDDYWTGYFTSRPFYKRMDRILQSYLRSSEILFSLMLDKEVRSGWAREQQHLLYSLMDSLTVSRRDLGLFQHHDGITGTARNHVVVDYAYRMLDALKATQHVIQQAVHSLLIQNKVEENYRSSVYFELGDEFKDYNNLAEEKVITVTKEISTVYVLNPKMHRRQQLLTIRTDSPYLEIKDRSGEVLQCQINPLFDKGGDLIHNQYEAHFVVSLEPLSIASYTVVGKELNEMDPKISSFGTVTFKGMTPPELPAIFTVQSKIPSQPFVIHLGRLTANFSSNGFLERLITSSHSMDIKIEFMSYGTWGSGAYLFLPRGAAKPLPVYSAPVISIEGSLTASITVYAQLFRHQVILRNSPGVDSLGLEIKNYVDIKNERDFELAMRLSSSVKNKNTFYTDLNGFQMIKRVTQEKLPLQGNFYPLPTQMFMEDQVSRLSILSSQPLGCAALKEGQMEIIMDRTSSSGDGRGLGYGIHDNVYTLNSFILLLEKRIDSQESLKVDMPDAYPSLASHALLSQMLYPSHVLHPKKSVAKYAKHWSVGGELPCDIEMVSMRPLLTKMHSAGVPSPSVALTLHRLGFSCSFPNAGLSCATTNGKVRLSELFPASFSEEVIQMSLSHLYEGVEMSKSYALALHPMQLYSFRLTLSSHN